MSKNDGLASLGFAELLAWHLTQGIRPDGQLGAPGRAWTNQEFGDAVGMSDRSVRYWIKDRVRPESLPTLERVLYGDNASFAPLRSMLRSAFDRARTRVPGRPKREPSRSDLMRPPRCLGREPEVRILTRMVSGSSQAALAVLGPPGVGKSTIALEVATTPEATRKYRHRRWFIPLETAKSADEMRVQIVGSILKTLQPSTFSQAATQLSRAKSLLVLDNLETPWDRDPTGVERLLQELAAIDTVTIMTTMRGREAPGAPSWSEPPVVLEPLAESAARELFLAIAVDIPGNDPLLQSFMRQLGGMPLAVELAALRSRNHLSLAEPYRELIASGSAFAKSGNKAVSAATSVEQSIRLSLESPRLLEEGRRLFALLGRLAAGLDDDHRHDILQADAFEAANQLVGLGLAYRTRRRLDLLPPIRDHAQRHVPPSPADTRAAARTYISLCASLGRMIGHGSSSDILTKIVTELPNIEWTLLSGLDSVTEETAEIAINALGDALGYSGAGSVAALQELEVHLAARPVGRLLGICRREIGRVLRWRSDFDGARAVFIRALHTFRRVNDPGSLADVLMRLADIMIWQSDIPHAQRLLNRAVRLAEVGKRPLVSANCIYYLGEVARRTSKFDDALSFYANACDRFAALDQERSRGDCLFRSAAIQIQRGQFAAAELQLRRANGAYRRSGGRLGLANVLASRAEIAFECGDLDGATRGFEKSLARAQRVGSRIAAANARIGLAFIALQAMDVADARRRFEAVRSDVEQWGDRHALAQIFRGLGETAAFQGDVGTSRKLLSLALTHARAAGSFFEIGKVEEQLARVASPKQRDSHLRSWREAWAFIGRAAG